MIFSICFDSGIFLIDHVSKQSQLFLLNSLVASLAFWKPYLIIGLDKDWVSGESIIAIDIYQPETIIVIAPRIEEQITEPTVACLGPVMSLTIHRDILYAACSTGTEIDHADLLSGLVSYQLEYPLLSDVVYPRAVMNQADWSRCPNPTFIQFLNKTSGTLLATCRGLEFTDASLISVTIGVNTSEVRALVSNQQCPLPSQMLASAHDPEFFYLACDDGILALNLRPFTCLSGQYFTAGNCVLCSIGTFMNWNQSQTPFAGGECSPCSGGSFQDEIGQTSCKPCQLSSSRQPSHFATHCLCPAEHEYSYNIADNGCVVCPLGSTSSEGGTCSPCQPGTYTPYRGSGCIVCNSMGLSCSNGIATVLEGYWIYTVNDDAIVNGTLISYPRYETTSCPAGACSRSSLLPDIKATSITPYSSSLSLCVWPRRNNLNNILCAECEDGFILWSGRCVECAGANAPLIVFALCLTFFFSLWLLYTSSRTSHIAAHVAVMLIFAQLSSLELASAINIFNGWIHYFNLSPKSSPSCLAPLTPIEQLRLTMLMPLIIMANMTVIAFVHWSTHECRYRIIGKNTPESNINVVQLNSNSSAVHIDSDNRIRSASDIEMHEMENQNQSENSSDLSRRSQSKERNHVKSAPENELDRDIVSPSVPSKQQSTSSAISSSFLSSSLSSPYITICGPLYLQYHSSAWYWQPLTLIRRAAYVVVSVLLTRQPVTRLTAFTLLNFASMVLHMAVRPFKENATFSMVEQTHGHDSKQSTGNGLLARFSLSLNHASECCDSLLLLISAVLIMSQESISSSSSPSSGHSIGVQLVLFFAVLPFLSYMIICVASAQLRGIAWTGCTSMGRKWRNRIENKNATIDPALSTDNHRHKNEIKSNDEMPLSSSPDSSSSEAELSSSPSSSSSSSSSTSSSSSSTGLYSRFSVWFFLPRPFDVYSYLSGFLAALLFSYISSCQSVAESLLCVSVGKNRRMFNAASVDCQSNEYHAHFALTIIVLIIYIIGLPLMMVVVLSERCRRKYLGSRREKFKLQSADEGDKKDGDKMKISEHAHEDDKSIENRKKDENEIAL